MSYIARGITSICHGVLEDWAKRLGAETPIVQNILEPIIMGSAYSRAHQIKLKIRPCLIGLFIYYISLYQKFKHCNNCRNRRMMYR